MNTKQPTLFLKNLYKSLTFHSFYSLSGSGMLGGWWFGMGGPSSPDSNYLRVSNNAFPNRRLSDNTLMTPKIRIAPSCASSPGQQHKPINSNHLAKEICNLCVTFRNFVYQAALQGADCQFADIQALGHKSVEDRTT